MGAALLSVGPLLPDIVWKLRYTNRHNTPEGWMRGSRKKVRGGVRKARYWRSRGIEEQFIPNFLRKGGQ